MQNVTDIDDRSIATATKEGVSVESVIANFYGKFKAGMRKLGVRDPDIEPYATQHIDAIVDMIAELVAKNHAYATDDGVYYNVKSFSRYGDLAHRDIDELLVGARIAENESKHDPLDFALWKFAKPGEPQWPSPWGSGRPGWHIECSAMSRELLGVPFDIHGGGTDLIFPHHENEIAQSEALMPPHEHMANVWIHGAMLNFDGRKMSKSLGNFEPLTALLERYDPLAIRLLFLQTGYRKPMNFTEDSINAASSGAEKLRRAYDALGGVTGAMKDAALADTIGTASVRFFDALDDDMNTAGAIGVLFDVANAAPKIVAAGEASAAGAARALLEDALGVLGVGDLLSRELAVAAASEVDPAAVERLRTSLADAVPFNGESPAGAIGLVIDARNAARKAKDFALADRLRKALAAEGITLTDGKDGTTTWTAAARIEPKRGGGGQRPPAPRVELDDVIYGIHAVNEAIVAGEPLRRLHIGDERKTDPALRNLIEHARASDVQVRFESRAFFANFPYKAHQSVIAYGAPFDYISLEEAIALPRKGPALFVVLDHVTDPHNVGAIIRTTEALGGTALILPDRRAVGINGTVRKAAAGATAHLPIAQVTNISPGRQNAQEGRHLGRGRHARGRRGAAGQGRLQPRSGDRDRCRGRGDRSLGCPGVRLQRAHPDARENTVVERFRCRFHPALRGDSAAPSVLMAP